MRDTFIKTLRREIKRPIFSDEDLKLLFINKSNTQIHSLVSYHLKNQHIIKLKRGLYCLINPDRSFQFSKFELANSMYSPSYVSFESALSHYNLIPEAVYEVSSACFLGKKKTFENDLGIFSYSYSPVSPFYLEIEKNDFLIAKPIRALFDLVNTRRKNYKAISDLEVDLRLDLEEFGEHLASYSRGEILKLGEAYKKKSTRALAKILIEEYK